MAADIQVTFPYMPGEHAEAMTDSSTGRWLSRVSRFSSMVAGASFLAIGVMLVADGQSFAKVVANEWPFVPLALGAFGAPAILKAVYRWQFRREGIREGRTVDTVSLGQNGVTPGARWSHPIPWSEVRRVEETKNLIVIDATLDGLTYLPKRALNAEDRARLDELLREQFRERPKDLRLTSSIVVR